MTVSPQWPDEGKIPQFPEGNPELANPAGPPNVLPPTLFQLPDLRIDSHASVGPTEKSGSASTRATSGSNDHVAEMPFGRMGSAGASIGHDPTNQSMARPVPSPGRGDDEPRFPTPPAVVDGSETPATSNRGGVNRESISRYGAENLIPDTAESTPVGQTDRPAGRSWMDSIGSHGIVVALLLVVVAAALYTGRAGKDDPDDSSLADGRDWLEYGTGEEISLPNATVADGVLADVDKPESTLDSGPAIAAAESPLDENMSTSTALLRQPVESDQLHGSDSTFAGTNSGSANQPFQQPHASLSTTASPAANRTGQLPSQSNQPRQTGQPNGYGIAVPVSQTPSYQQTATPTGISDWSKYFPAVSSSNAVGTTYPSPSN